MRGVNIWFSLVFLLSCQPDQTHLQKVEDLAKLINAECSVCPNYEKYLVASVVVNRIESPEFPGTFLSVINQPNQFADYEDSFVTGETIKIADDVLRGRNVTQGIHYFYRPDTATDTVFTNWASKNVVVHARYHNFSK